MLTCAELMDLLMEQDIDDLPPEPRAAAESHLAGCGGCAAFVRSLHAVTPMVRDAMELEVDPALQAELDAAVMEALRKQA
jgi:hypothetical protein